MRTASSAINAQLQRARNGAFGGVLRNLRVYVVMWGLHRVLADLDLLLGIFVYVEALLSSKEGRTEFKRLGVIRRLSLLDESQGRVSSEAPFYICVPAGKVSAVTRRLADERFKEEIRCDEFSEYRGSNLPEELRADINRVGGLVIDLRAVAAPTNVDPEAAHRCEEPTTMEAQSEPAPTERAAGNPLSGREVYAVDKAFSSTPSAGVSVDDCLSACLTIPLDVMSITQKSDREPDVCRQNEAERRPSAATNASAPEIKTFSTVSEQNSSKAEVGPPERETVSSARRDFTEAERLKALAQVDKGRHYRPIAAELGMSKSTIGKWVKKRDGLRGDANGPIASPKGKRQSTSTIDAIADVATRTMAADLVSAGGGVVRDWWLVARIT
jgi:hypothetical protein